MKTQFTETQKFTQWWLWVLLIGLFIFPIYRFYDSAKQGENLIEFIISDTSLLIYMTIIFLVIVLFAMLRLDTHINTMGIQMRYVPFVKKKVGWSEIESVKVIDYGFVGGWGIRLWTSYGTVYNVKGSKGLFIRLKNGKKFLIGTQKPVQLDEYLQKLHL